MNKEEITKIINQLTGLSGYVIPVGETNEDKRRYNNLIDRSEFLLDMISEIKQASQDKDRAEHSMKT